MPDTSGPAFPVMDADHTTHLGMTRRTYLIAHAPPPDPDWLIQQRADHIRVEYRARHEHAKTRKIDEHAPIRIDRPEPTNLELDVRWRQAWADRVLAANKE